MEETKDQQSFYKLLRTLVYASLLVEFFEYVVSAETLAPAGRWLVEIHQRIGSIPIYQPGNLLYSRLTTIILVIVCCIGTKARKSVEFDAQKMVLTPVITGFALTVISLWLYHTAWLDYIIVLYTLNIWLYMACSVIGTLLIHVALDNISKHIKDGIMKDRFNFEMEAFEQNEKINATPYSVNIPMRYYYKGKFRHGWININNPFRGTFVIGTPGSGKSFSVVEPFIRQQAAKGFSMVVYDYKFPTLATKLYYHYCLNMKQGKAPKGCKFNIINFVDVEYSMRVNPMQHKYIPDLAAAQETAETLVESLQKGKKEGGGGSDQFFQTSAVNFLASCIFFFINYKRMPYDEKGNQLWPEYEEDKETHHRKLTGRVFDTEAHRDAAEEALKIGISISTGLVTPAYWLGKYSDMPHVLSFLNHDYAEIFEILKTDPEVYPLLGPFMTAYENKAMEQLEGMIGTLRVQISRLATKEAYWIFHKDGDDFDLKVSDPEHPSYLLIANDPEKESIIGALNAMILNRLVTRVNSGQGKNIPVSIIVDELPTLYFHKIDNLIATARSNKVCVLLGFQELPQLEANYGKTNMEKITATIGNVISGSARNKETLEWLSNDIMGKTIQLKKNLSIDEAKTSVSFNEGLENMLPPSKIADMATGWLCGQTARDFSVTKTGPGGSMNIQESEEFKTTKFFCKTDFNMAELKQEDKNIEAMIERRVQNEIAKHEANGPLTEAQKKAIRKDTHIFNKFYDFKTKAAREQRLYANFNKVNQEVIDMINEIQTEFKKE